MPVANCPFFNFCLTLVVFNVSFFLHSAKNQVEQVALDKATFSPAAQPSSLGYSHFSTGPRNWEQCTLIETAWQPRPEGRGGGWSIDGA